MEKTKGKTSNPVKQDDSIKTVHAILSKISDSKFSNQSDLKILRNIRLIELTNRLTSCLDALEKYGEITIRKESLHHQLRVLNESLKEDINLIEMPVEGHWFENKSFTEVSADEFGNLRLENIHDQRSLNMFLRHCLTLLFFNENSGVKMTDDEKREYNILEYLITGRAWETLGYWTAKLEIMKQNKDNVKQRTTTKEKRKAELKEWMKIMKIKDCRLRAQKEFDVTERTVLKYLQEIRDEKTAIMRKKGDTA